jgi:hypothetical protein
MRYRQTNNKGEYTMTGVYAEIQSEMQAEADKLKYDSCHITIAMFTRVVNLYIQKMLEDVIENGSIWKLLNKFGYLFIAQSVCIRYNPTKTYFVTENGHVTRKQQKIQLVNGRIPHFFWDTGKIWRMYKFVPAVKFKRRMYEKFLAGMQYETMDLTKYGRKASATYIQFRK